MVKKLVKAGKEYFQCEECGFNYKDKRDRLKNARNGVKRTRVAILRLLSML